MRHGKLLQQRHLLPDPVKDGIPAQLRKQNHAPLMPFRRHAPREPVLVHLRRRPCPVRGLLLLHMQPLHDRAVVQHQRLQLRQTHQPVDLLLVRKRIVPQRQRLEPRKLYPLLLLRRGLANGARAAVPERDGAKVHVAVEREGGEGRGRGAQPGGCKRGPEGAHLGALEAGLGRAVDVLGADVHVQPLEAIHDALEGGAGDERLADDVVEVLYRQRADAARLLLFRLGLGLGTAHRRHGVKHGGEDFEPLRLGITEPEVIVPVRPVVVARAVRREAHIHLLHGGQLP